MSLLDRSNRIRRGQLPQRHYPPPKVKISGDACSKDNDNDSALPDLGESGQGQLPESMINNQAEYEMAIQQRAELVSAIRSWEERHGLTHHKRETHL